MFHIVLIYLFIIPLWWVVEGGGDYEEEEASGSGSGGVKLRFEMNTH